MELAKMTEFPYAVWLYGSRARGDADALSDTDVLAVADSPPSPEDAAACVGMALGCVSVSSYSWTEVQAMAAYGSVFLHHVRLEGIPLFENDCCKGRLSSMLEGLGPYRRARQDVSAFRTVLADVKESMSNGGSPTYESSVLGTVLRHASMLGCFVSGCPTFGRLTPVWKLVGAGIIHSDIWSEFSTLYSARLYASGRGELSFKPTWEDVSLWLNRASSFLDELEVLANEYDGGLS
jgi:hypothetical protein